MSGQRGLFFWFSAVSVTILVIALLPAISVSLTYVIASALGCSVNEGGATPCPFMGVDLGETLVTMMVLGWLGLLTLPVGGVALAVWLAAWIGRRIWHRRQLGQGNA
jgi:hypothetical protein